MEVYEVGAPPPRPCRPRRGCGGGGVVWVAVCSALLVGLGGAFECNVGERNRGKMVEDDGRVCARAQHRSIAQHRAASRSSRASGAAGPEHAPPAGPDRVAAEPRRAEAVRRRRCGARSTSCRVAGNNRNGRFMGKLQMRGEASASRAAGTRPARGRREAGARPARAGARPAQARPARGRRPATYDTARPVTTGCNWGRTGHPRR